MYAESHLFWVVLLTIWNLVEYLYIYQLYLINFYDEYDNIDQKIYKLSAFHIFVRIYEKNMNSSHMWPIR